MSSGYKKALQLNKKKTREYYIKSLEKTEQQKFLEKILSDSLSPAQFKLKYSIADIACGGGTLSYHLSSAFINSEFTLVDINDDALEIARSINTGSNFSFRNDSIFELVDFQDETFDLVFCWQTLSWIDEPQKALEELIRVTKKGGSLFLSSLFNLDHDVDIYSKVFDFTLESGNQGIPFSYNTYSAYSVSKWLTNLVKSFKFIPFKPGVDFKYEGRGLGTFTIATAQERLQISAGQLLNWAILQIQK